MGREIAGLAQQRLKVLGYTKEDELKRLLDYTMRPHHEKAENAARYNPMLIFSEPPLGCTTMRISPLQYACRVSDSRMIDIFRNVIAELLPDQMERFNKLVLEQQQEQSVQQQQTSVIKGF